MNEKKDDGLEKKKKDSSLGGTLSSKMILGLNPLSPLSLNYILSDSWAEP